jgi:serine/threonine-protein kinase RIO1
LYIFFAPMKAKGSLEKISELSKGLGSAGAKRRVALVVRVLAEQEFRNLLRLQQAKINAPRPVAERQHLLLMEFIGKDGLAAQKLKDAVEEMKMMEEEEEDEEEDEEEEEEEDAEG